ncbi:hypothetical protein DL96DRAFT_589828 [Flagelloscypha sp. PMI_526]|nr:hypothetical protein DL96DRAFT_589828 [Flagelloscypha sp. PMI_526]
MLATATRLQLHLRPRPMLQLPRRVRSQIPFLVLTQSPQPIPTPPGVRRTSPFSAQSPPPPRPSTTSPFSSSAPSLPSSQPPMPSPFQNPFPHERTTTPFTPFNNPFESPQQQPNSTTIPPIPPFVPPQPQASSHDWDQPFVLGQPPLPLGKRAQRPVIDTSTPKHQRQPPSPPSATMTQQVSLDSRSPIQAPDPRRPLAQEDGNSHLFRPSSHASHLPVGHQQHQEMTSHQVPWMSAQQAGQVPPQEQHWQEQQNNEFYRYQHPPAGREQAPAPTTMEALQLGVGLGLGIDPGSGEWPPEQVMEVDMVPVSQLDGGVSLHPMPTFFLPSVAHFFFFSSPSTQDVRMGRPTSASVSFLLDRPSTSSHGYRGRDGPEDVDMDDSPFSFNVGGREATAVTTSHVNPNPRKRPLDDDSTPFGFNLYESTDERPRSRRRSSGPIPSSTITTGDGGRPTTSSGFGFSYLSLGSRDSGEGAISTRVSTSAAPTAVRSEGDERRTPCL